jgi:hypothetical protein
MEQLGFVLRELDKLGVTNIGHELVTDVLLYKQRAPRVPALVTNGAAPAKPRKIKTGPPRYEIRNKAFMLQYFNDREQVTAAEMTELFKKDGRNPSSAGSLLTQLAQEKYCKSMGEGVWKVSIKGQKAAAKETTDV